MYMNSEAEKGQAADPLSWVRSRSNEHPSALIGHTDLKVWNFKTSSALSSVLPFLTSLEDKTLRGLLMRFSSWLWYSGGWRDVEALLPSSSDRREALTGCFHYFLDLRGFDTNWKRNLFCHKRLSITHRESDYG